MIEDPKGRDERTEEERTEEERRESQQRVLDENSQVRPEDVPAYDPKNDKTYEDVSRRIASE